MALWTLSTVLLDVVGHFAGKVITSAIRREIARQFVIASVLRIAPIPTPTSILNTLIGGGFGIRRQDFFRLYRATVPYVKMLDRQVDYRSDRPIRVGDIPVYPGQLSREYLYEFRLDVWNDQTHQWDSQMIRMSSNDRMSKSMAEEQMEGAFAEEALYPHLRLESLSFVRVWRRTERV